MTNSKLEAVLDYILNHASGAEFEVIVKAVERRRKDMGRFAKMGGKNPGAIAEAMAASLSEGVNQSIDNLKGSLKGFLERTIREQAPNASEREIQSVLEGILPDEKPEPKKGELPKEAIESALPPEAILLMLRDFIDYSLGQMAASKQTELWESVPSWPEKYWEAFPPALKSFVKAHLEGRMDGEDFWKAAFSVLGL